MEPNKKSNEETKNNKNRGAQKKQCSRKVRGVSPEAGGSLWWERFVKEVGLELDNEQASQDGET